MLISKKYIQMFPSTICFALLMLLGFSLPSCTNQNKSEDQDPSLFQKVINEYVYKGLNVKLGETRSDIIQTLGEPLSVTKQKINNVHNMGQIDEINEFKYDGLLIKIYVVSETKKEIIISLSVTSDAYDLKWGLNIGSSLKDIKNRLGNPHEEKDGLYIYQTDGAPSTIDFHFRDNKVYQIDWKFYWD